MNGNKILDGFLKDKKIGIIVIVGFIGIALIFLSQILEGDKKDKNTASQENSGYSLEEYTQKLEDKLLSLVSGIEGVGKARVMVTFESDTEYVYVDEETKNYDITEDVNGENAKTKKEQENTQRTLITVEGEDGEKALLKTKIEPKVKGVVVVCTGGDSAAVQQRVCDALTTALDIDYDRVCVTKLSE